MRNARGFYRPGTVALGAALIGALTLASAPSTASAQSGVGAVRLGADVNIINITDFPDLANGFTFGLGPIGQGLGPSIAFQLADWVVVGGRIVLRFNFFDEDLTSDLDLTYTGTFGILPFVEFLVNEGDARFYVGAEAGFLYNWTEVTDTGVSAVFGPIAGVHIFATDSFSISPGVSIDFLYNSFGEVGGFQLLGYVSFLGWMGGGAQATVEYQQQQQPVYQEQQQPVYEQGY